MASRISQKDKVCMVTYEAFGHTYYNLMDMHGQE
jgi:hypothetical protein